MEQVAQQICSTTTPRGWGVEGARGTASTWGGAKPVSDRRSVIGVISQEMINSELSVTRLDSRNTGTITDGAWGYPSQTRGPQLRPWTMVLNCGLQLSARIAPDPCAPTVSSTLYPTLRRQRRKPLRCRRRTHRNSGGFIRRKKRRKTMLKLTSHIWSQFSLPPATIIPSCDGAGSRGAISRNTTLSSRSPEVGSGRSGRRWVRPWRGSPGGGGRRSEAGW